MNYREPFHAVESQLDLTVVMPVYNEEQVIGHTLRSWLSMLDELAINYELIALNDGSRDQTSEVLEEFASENKITVVEKSNEGHGPTILRGYWEATKRSNWVFQVDSDNEMSADAFPKFWELSKEADVILGYRTGRSQTLDRKLISVIAGWTVRVAYGCKLRDVNCPYRLIRSNLLVPILEFIPNDTFAPNVIISGTLARCGFQIIEVTISILG